jgi:hypothetical protein
MRFPLPWPAAAAPAAAAVLLPPPPPPPEGVTAAFLDQLPRWAFDGGPAGGSTCSVCLAPFERGETLLTLPCLHFFHAACATAWLADHAHCPVCRGRVAAEDAGAGAGAGVAAGREG